MHKKLIEEATHEQLKDFLYDYLGMLKGTQPELYNEAEDILYRNLYGNHFNEWSLSCALSKLQNEDGTTGGHWTLEETSNAARSIGVRLEHYNEYDWNYTMNMLYSDFSKVVGRDANIIAKMAVAFLEDKDAPEGKAYKYWNAMK